MNPRLAAMLSLVGVLGVAVLVYTPQPGSRTMAELRDGGIMLGQPVAVLSHEKDVSRATANRVRRLQGADIIRPGQRMLTMLRTGRCFGDKYLDGGFGNCVRLDGGSLEPFVEEVTELRYTHADGGREWNNGRWPVSDFLDDGGVAFLQPDRRADGGYFERIGTVPRQSELIIPSLRRDLDGGVTVDDGGADEAGDNDVADDAQQLSFTMLHCAQVDALVDAGELRNPYATRFCGGLNRVAAQPEPCMMPNGWRARADGGLEWCEEACGVVDCRAVGPYGEQDGGPRWRGFNVTPREYAVGGDCVPVECTVQAGDVPAEWL